MTARTVDVDDFAPFERRGTGVRVCGETQHTYDLTVIARDPARVVASAGGWLCDRVRAGWQVTVLVPADQDTGALTILGVRVDTLDDAVDALRARPAAVAVDAQVLRDDEQLRRHLLQIVDNAAAEVTIWGESVLFGADARFDRVRHRLSAAAKAFKARALYSAQLSAPESEEFVAAALWYPLDGADLVPVPQS